MGSCAVTIPVRLVSESNAHEHWRSRQKRAKSQRATVAAVARSVLARPALPCVIRITRIAPKALDRNNLDGSAKHVVDGLADWLGIDDRDPRVAYVCEQERGAKGDYAVRVEVIPGAVVRTEIVKA
jgi:hypothetical protein